MLVALVLSALILPWSGPAVSDDEAVQSLQELLETARAKYAEAKSRLAPQVALVVERLEALGRPSPRKQIEDLRAELDHFGPPGASLLLAACDPGLEPTRAQTFRAEEVKDALARLGTGDLTAELTLMLGTATLPGRLHAIELLGMSTDQAGAGASLRGVFRASKSGLRAALVHALIHLGGTENMALPLASMETEDTSYRVAVVAACADAARLEAAPAIAALVLRPEQAKDVLNNLTAYYTACPTALESSTLIGIFDLVDDSRWPVRGRSRLLNAIADLNVRLESDARSRLKSLSNSAIADISEGALIMLALQGDRSAKRDILRSYDRDIDNSPRFSAAYEQRAEVLVRLELFKDAARDFKKAIELLQRRESFVSKDLWINLSRSQARAGKAKAAYETLREADLPPSELHRLAEDPDFALLVEHSRYKKLFE